MLTEPPTVYVAGSLFLDIVMSGLRHAPRPGEEQWVPDGGIMPGGAANQAICCSRLGLTTSLISYLGTDRAGTWTAEMLAEDDICLKGTLPVERQNVTVSLVMDGDRAFTTYGSTATPLPRPGLAPPTVFLCSVGYLKDSAQIVAQWREAGTIVIADAAWDDTGAWLESDLEPLQYADVFVPNCIEAQHYTRTLTTEEAASALLDRIDTVVVTCGAEGSYLATRDDRGDQARFFPAIPVEAIDTTGAGDAFSSGLAAGLATGARIEDAVHFGQLAAAWTVQHIGGSTCAPRLAELVEWSGKPECESFSTAITTIADSLGYVAGGTAEPAGA